MSARTKQLAEIAKQGEEGVQKAQEYERYKAKTISECLFQLTGDLCEAVKTAKDEFNAVVGRDSMSAINHLEQMGCGVKLVKEHYPSVYLTAVINPGAQCIIVECVKTDRSGRHEQPASRYPLEVENSWVRIRDGERLITESEFADLLIERFV